LGEFVNYLVIFHKPRFFATEHFTFEELTFTAKEEYKEKNQIEAENYENNLRRVALELLEPIRTGLEKQIDVHSGFRGDSLNRAVGGSVTSQHCVGEAADFNVKGYDDRKGQIAVVQWIKDKGIKFGQLLLERGCIHISLGDKMEIAEYSVETKTKQPIKEIV